MPRHSALNRIGCCCSPRSLGFFGLQFHPPEQLSSLEWFRMLSGHEDENNSLALPAVCLSVVSSAAASGHSQNPRICAPASLLCEGSAQFVISCRLECTHFYLGIPRAVWLYIYLRRWWLSSSSRSRTSVIKNTIKLLRFLFASCGQNHILWVSPGFQVQKVD